MTIIESSGFDLVHILGKMGFHLGRVKKCNECEVTESKLVASQLANPNSLNHNSSNSHTRDSQPIET